ncbi:MAG: hypothetical protein HY327_08055 [Chloroflexi bacterium]|nr:hypothetical protein [Chloroflexota bacterium]
MKKKIDNEMNDELRPEYDLHTLLKQGVRGKYAERYRVGTNLVLLDPDIAREFPDDQAVNEALRLVLELNRVTKKRTAKA